MFDQGPSGNCQSSNCGSEQSFIKRTFLSETFLRPCPSFSRFKSMLKLRGGDFMSCTSVWMSDFSRKSVVNQRVPAPFCHGYQQLAYILLYWFDKMLQDTVKWVCAQLPQSHSPFVHFYLRICASSFIYYVPVWLFCIFCHLNFIVFVCHSLLVYRLGKSCEPMGSMFILRKSLMRMQRTGWSMTKSG